MPGCQFRQMRGMRRSGGGGGGGSGGAFIYFILFILHASQFHSRQAASALLLPGLSCIFAIFC